MTSQIVNHPDQSLCICLEILGSYWGFKVFPEALQNTICSSQHISLIQAHRKVSLTQTDPEGRFNEENVAHKVSI